MITKNCQTCGKGFGFFNKKAICQCCSMGFCEKCLQTNQSFPESGILPVHKVCAKCITDLQKPKTASASPTSAPKTFTLGGSAAAMTGAPKDSSMLDRQLEEMMEEQQFPLNVRERTRTLDVAQKWQLIRAYEQSLTLEKNEKNQPGYWVEKLQNPSSQIWKDTAKMQRFLNTIKSQSKTWCVQLLRDKGLTALLEGFHQCKNDEVRVYALKAINAIITTRAGLEAFLALPAAFSPLILHTLNGSNDARFEIFEFLATVVGFSSDQGLSLVLEAMTHSQAGRIPFKPFITMLTAPQTSHAVRFKLLVLINAVVNSADLLEDRQRTRQLLRSADFTQALQWLRTEITNVRAAIDGAASTRSVASPSIVRQSVAVDPGTISLEEARQRAQSTVITAQGVSSSRIIDHGEIWEMIRVQIELYEHAEEDDSIDATRAGVDFGSIEQLLEYIRVHMTHAAGQYLLPLLQMICILPLDGQKSQHLWSAVLTVVKRVISASNSNENLSLEQLFQLTEQYAAQATMSASDAILHEKANLEQQLNVMRQKIHDLETQLTKAQQAAPSAAVAVPEPSTAPVPSSNKELQQLKAEMLGLRTELSRAQKALEEKEKELANIIPGPPPADTSTPQTATIASPEQAAELQKALQTITALEAEIAALKAGGASAPASAAVSTGPMTITINTPQPPCLPGFNPVPHQPRTVVIPAGAPIPAGTGGAAASGAPAAPAPTSNIPTPPVLPGFKGAPGAAGPAAAGGAAVTAPSGGANCQPDGKPWPPVLPGFKAAPGNPNAGGAAGPSAAGASAGHTAAATAPAAPVEPPIKLPYTRRAIKPVAKMRNIHWAKLEEKAIESTLWFNLNDQKNVKLNTSELESMFCQAAPKAPSAGGEAAGADAAGKPATAAKQQQVTFVEGQRGQNMAIAVSRFRPLTFEQIRDAILQVDTKSLSLDVAVAMSKWLPTPEEVEAVTSYDGPINDLAQTDKFILIVGKVPALDRRLDAFIFKCQYQQTFDELQQKIQQCTTVLENINKSKSLIKVLEYVLAIGNYLNGGTKKGDAYGFEIAYLTQLANTRSCDNKTNLLQYLVPIFDADAQTASLSDTFVGVEEASRIDIAQLTGDVGKFNAAINKINGLIKQLSAKPAPGDRFVEIMTPFAGQCEPKAKQLQDSLQNIQAIAKSLATSYGEEPGKFGPTQLFALFHEFNKQINATRAELKRQAEMKEKQEKQAAAAAQRAAAGGGAPKGLPGGPGGPGGKPQSGLEGADGMNALQMALAQRKDRPPVVPPRKQEQKAEDEVGTQTQGLLTGADAGSVLAAIKARREERTAQQNSMGGGKRRSVFGTQPEAK